MKIRVVLSVLILVYGPYPELNPFFLFFKAGAGIKHTGRELNLGKVREHVSLRAGSVRDGYEEMAPMEAEEAPVSWPQSSQ